MEHKSGRLHRFEDHRDGEGRESRRQIDAARTAARAGRVRLIYRNSESFRLLEQLFNIGDRHGQHGIELSTNSKYRAMHKLLANGLVKQSEELCSGCDHPHVQYSLTLMGRAHYIASRLGLSFPQLCYLACAREIMRHPFYLFSEMFPWTEAIDGPFGNIFLHQVRGKVVVSELARKGFLDIYAGRTADWGPRFRDVEAHGKFLDELYLWLQFENARILLEASRDPTKAKLARFFLGTNVRREEGQQGNYESVAGSSS